MQVPFHFRLLSWNLNDAPCMKEAGNLWERSTPSGELSSGRVGSGPGNGEGLGAGSRDRQEMHTCGSSSLGFGGLDQGVSSWCSLQRNPETETRKPAAAGSMLLVCPLEITDTKPIRRKISDVADWPALWYPENRWNFLSACSRTEPNSKIRIIHGSAHRSANGVAMPTDEDDQDGHFFYNHPERGAYSAA